MQVDIHIHTPSLSIGAGRGGKQLLQGGTARSVSAPFACARGPLVRSRRLLLQVVHASVYLRTYVLHEGMHTARALPPPSPPGCGLRVWGLGLDPQYIFM